MRFMNQVFRPYISKFIVVYFNDILIYNKIEREHQNHLTHMMVLESENLLGYLKKCTFFTNKVTLLGYIVIKNEIQMDESKIKAIRSWPTP